MTTVNIEGETAASIARTMLLPAAIQWYGDARARPTTTTGVAAPKAELDGLIDEFVEAIFALETANRDHPEDGDILEEAKYVQTTVLPAMEAVREVADRLEKDRAGRPLAAAEVRGDPLHQVGTHSESWVSEGPAAAGPSRRCAYVAAFGPCH